jgi:hypothetical protein
MNITNVKILINKKSKNFKRKNKNSFNYMTEWFYCKLSMCSVQFLKRNLWLFS